MHLLVDYRYSAVNFEGSRDPIGYQEYGVGLGWDWNIPVMTTVVIGGANLDSTSSASSLSGMMYKLEFGYFFSEKFKATLVIPLPNCMGKLHCHGRKS